MFKLQYASQRNDTAVQGTPMYRRMNSIKKFIYISNQIHILLINHTNKNNWQEIWHCITAESDALKSLETFPFQHSPSARRHNNDSSFKVILRSIYGLHGKAQGRRNSTRCLIIAAAASLQELWVHRQ